MKKIIGVALFFLVAAAPTLAGSNAGGGAHSGGTGMSGGTIHSSLPFGGSRAQAPARSFAPQTRETPMKYAQPQRKRAKGPWVATERYNTYQWMCPNPYQRNAAGINGCVVNPWVLYAFPNNF